MTKNLNRIVYLFWVLANTYLFGYEVGEFAAGGDLGMLILMGFVLAASVGLLIYTWNTDPKTGCGLE